MSEPNKNLWAPWRLDYIRELDTHRNGCFLCDYWADPASDEKNLVLWRTERSLVVLNRFPYTNGHLLIAPARHVGQLHGLNDAELHELLALARDAQLTLAAAFNAQGFNTGANFGHCAGAGLPDHLHFHVVPRWGGDTNYMAVLDDVRVIPQSLAAAYEQLKETGKKLGLPKG
ncbi:MAG: HIT domain-containing protein [Phycisphaerae bacterium]|nr:HIT domain-containing protein [Phycisphaerae bacterium]